MPTAVIRIFPPAGAKFNAVNYSAKKEKTGKANLLHFQNFGALDNKSTVSKKEFELYLQNYSKRNKYIKNPVFHAALSAKGQELSHKQLKDIALELMEGLGYKDNPLLIYAHYDTNNNHVHIVSSRVGMDGKKIAHDFEKKRAVEIVNHILNKNTDREFTQALNESLSYRFSTSAQFVLLMERKGYTTKMENNTLQCYKYGFFQGSVSEKLIKEKIQPPSNGKSDKQIQALIYKYAKSFNTTLHIYKTNPFGNNPKIFSSELTDFLKKQFGLDFIFFVGKEKEKPYGYAIIDHRHKEVFKGSEIMSLNYLINLNSSESKSVTSQTTVDSGYHQPKSSENTTNQKNINDTAAQENTPQVQQQSTTNGNSSFIEDILQPLPDEASVKPKHLDDEEEWWKKRRRR